MFSCSIMSTLCNPMNCSLPGSSVHGDSPGKNTGMGCHALLQGNLPNPGIKPGSPALQADSLPSEPPGSQGWGLLNLYSDFNHKVFDYTPAILFSSSVKILVYRTWKSEHWSDAQSLCNARVFFISSLTDCYCSFLTVSPWWGAHGFVRRQPLLWRKEPTYLKIFLLPWSLLFWYMSIVYVRVYLTAFFTFQINPV